MRFSTSLSYSWFLTTPNPVGQNMAPVGDQNSSIQVTVYPEWYTQMSLEWTIPSSWVGARFHVYYWPGGNEAYIRLTTTPISNQFFSDSTTKEYSKTQEGHYIVEVILPFTTQIVRSYPTSWNYKRRDKIEKIANEIQRREYLLLSKFAGTKAFFFRKKTYGVRCPRCWSAADEKVMDDHCEVCYGTSFEGGYYDPIPVFIQFDPTPTNKQKAYQGVIEPGNFNAWTISIPEMTYDDVIIRVASWNVFKIVSSQPTELQTKPVKQVLNITQLSRSDVENRLVTKIQSENASTYLSQFETPFNKQRFPQNLIDKKPENDPAWAKDQNLPSLPEYKL